MIILNDFFSTVSVAHANKNCKKSPEITTLKYIVYLQLNTGTFWWTLDCNAMRFSAAPAPTLVQY
jgi:hypothetical protein